ncbi:MAG: DUF2065 domain-containing protein [Deltaproteobacteria bacterium CG_4_8_14_3_um_filter_51_11]|nr:DUF2065 domain-containing protein [bacterium]OIP41085.1 MAG: hypothetical protein AUK25_06370 [Desulfobacteraceae bacterium CG2_30_51_40]PIP45168.1 MAG: hypothetical protein COX16_14605 [Deltaproteobacteria bacterium CG23_combo_of_CG06-09_8_20_14_all_51_20]PIV99764.1 MAG: DUF2065 domain-containing protein [Deltaproteobacteria bacterium CG17_big_fil_post_rev_8_21_14_2_50_51_6]PIX20461.1 MAG: DUF2065 domain-containing protein [Deltaproteobacteria bacterium CG_4_8_14_3_um_filter_51_11]PIY21566
MKTILFLIGLILFVEGLPYFAFPDKMRRATYRLLESPDYRLRTIGFVSMATGLVLAYLFRE